MGPQLLSAAVLLLPSAVAAGGSAEELLRPREIPAVRIAPGAVHVDGHLDEPAWARAPVGSRLVQSSPTPGAEATLRTEFRVLADDQAIYVGVRLFDPRPGDILDALGRRDDENVADWCFVELDSRLDRRSGFSLGVNAGGLQADGAWSADSVYDGSWNAVYETAVSIDAEGWIAEFRIPFSQLPFVVPPGAAELTFGLNIYRSNPRTGEVSNWAPRLPELSGIVSRFNLLHLPVPPATRRLELSPYVRADLGRNAHGAWRGWRSGGRAGLDLRAGLGTALTLTATVLPDFGQVEADPTQLNLSGYELFLTERRPFFTEGMESFRFDASLPLVTRDDSFADETPFYSRRIGRAPQGSLPDGATVFRRPVVGDLLGAAKVSGRTASGWRVGLLAAWTGASTAELAPDGRAWPLEPAALSFVGRLSRERADGDADLGLLVTGLHRPGLDGALAEVRVRDAWVGGVDGRLRFAERTWEARAWVLGSVLAGGPRAVAQAAEGGLHGFGRPDAPELALPPGVRHLSGVSAEARLAKVGGALQGLVALRTISPGFDMNELGFQRNANWHLVVAQWSWQAYPAGGALRKWVVGTDDAGLGWTWQGQRRAAVVGAFVEAYFRNYWDVRLAWRHDFPAFAPEWLHGGPALLLPDRDTVRVTAHTNTRSPSGLTLDATGWTEPASGSRLLSVTPSATLRLGPHVFLTLSATFIDQRLGWAWLGAGPDQTSPWVSRLHQRSLTASLQADVAFSPRLVLQLYAQPFASSGAADGWARLASPAASVADERFQPVDPSRVSLEADTVRVSGESLAFSRPDVSQRTLQASAVLRWEFQPGSFLTGVWTHRGDVVLPGPAPLGAQLRRALVEPGEDVFLVKLNVFLTL